MQSEKMLHKSKESDQLVEELDQKDVEYDTLTEILYEV